MNNGKVRIYELSRELNLDNKDILAVWSGSIFQSRATAAQLQNPKQNAFAKRLKNT